MISMNQNGKSTFSVLFLIKRTRLLKNGEAPIAMRLTVKGRSSDIMIKRGIEASLWNQSKECSKGKDHAAKELNHFLESTKTRIYQIQRELMEEKKPVTLETVRDRYYGNDPESAPERTICGIYSEHNEKCRALIGVDFTDSTVEKFDTSLNRIKEFIKHQYKKDDLPLSEVNGEFVRNLDFYIKTVHKCKQNSTIKHLKNLKKVIRIALANEWIKKDPFYGFQFKHEEVNVEFLTNEELQRIINKEFTFQRLAQVRDVFVFCCYTGLAFIDVQQLAPDHLTTDVNGKMWIRKNRQKTGTMCNIPILSKAKEIIERYGDHPDCVKKGVLLPVMANQNMNAYLKEIADVCGIKKRLSTHVARHTCATTVMLANNVRMENVSKILGHSSTKMTQHYAKVLDSSIMQDMEHVERKIASL